MATIQVLEKRSLLYPSTNLTCWMMSYRFFPVGPQIPGEKFPKFPDTSNTPRVHPGPDSPSVHPGFQSWPVRNISHLQKKKYIAANNHVRGPCRDGTEYRQPSFAPSNRQVVASDRHRESSPAPNGTSLGHVAVKNMVCRLRGILKQMTIHRWETQDLENGQRNELYNS